MKLRNTAHRSCSTGEIYHWGGPQKRNYSSLYLVLIPPQGIANNHYKLQKLTHSFPAIFTYSYLNITAALAQSQKAKT